MSHHVTVDYSTQTVSLCDVTVSFVPPSLDAMGPIHIATVHIPDAPCSMQCANSVRIKLPAKVDIRSTA